MVKNMYSHFTSTTTAYGTRNVRRPATLARLSLNINNIEKTVSIDHTKHKKIPVRINSTFNVIRACMFILLSVLEVTQRVPPTCTTKTDFTYVCCDNSRCNRSNVARMLASCSTPCRPRLRALPSDPRDPCDAWSKSRIVQKDEFQQLSWSKRKIVKKFELSKVIIANKNHCQTQSRSNTI